MSVPKTQLDCLDLSTNSRNTLAALTKLLAPHVPYSLPILGTILNSGPRTSTLQLEDVDPSKISLWSTIPLYSNAISTTAPALFSIVAFSHLTHQFIVFCSGESNMSSNPPTEAEKMHIKQVLECLLDVAREARPTYYSLVTPYGDRLTQRIDTDPPMITIGGVHPKWAKVFAPVATRQNPVGRYVIPRGSFPRDSGFQTMLGEGHASFAKGEVEVSEIQASDLPFVHGASSVPRSDAYILSRAPYSVCLRIRGDSTGMLGTDGGLGRPVACALMHADGSIGALRVDPTHQHRGLGRLVVGALVEKLNLSLNGRGDIDLVPDDHQDLGGGALGWNWMDADARNEAGNRFLISLVGEENRWICHWTYIPIDGIFPSMGAR